MKGNDFVIAILKSPLHWILSGNMMVLTVTGRKSGRPITLPVSYYRDGNVLWISSKLDRQWWHNLIEGGMVLLHFRGRDMEGKGELVRNPDKVVERLIAMIAVKPQYRKAFNIRLNANATLNLEDLNKLAKERLFVKITLKM